MSRIIQKSKCHLLKVLQIFLLIEFQSDTQIESRIKKIEDKCTEQEEKYKDLKKIFDGKLLAKNEEISRLQDHNQKLLTQIKKSKDTKHRSQPPSTLTLTKRRILVAIQ
jgi:uncharacterized coiled-coil protein SlyX